MEWIERIVRFVVSQMICIPFFKRPFQDLSHPQAYGMKNTENLRLAVNDNQEIGAWFMLPTTPAGKSDGNKGEIPHSLNSDKQKVVLVSKIYWDWVTAVALKDEEYFVVSTW